MGRFKENYKIKANKYSRNLRYLIVMLWNKPALLNNHFSEIFQMHIKLVQLKKIHYSAFKQGPNNTPSKRQEFNQTTIRLLENNLPHG